MGEEQIKRAAMYNIGRAPSRKHPDVRSAPPNRKLGTGKIESPGTV